MITSISEEFWAFQYLTRPYRDPQWWPVDGTGKYRTKEAAEEAARINYNYCESVRAIHVQRTIRFEQEFDPRVQVPDDAQS